MTSAFSVDVSDKIPYMHVYDTSDDTSLIYLIPAEVVRVSITNVQYDEDHGIHVLNPHLSVLLLPFLNTFLDGFVRFCFAASRFFLSFY